jgi:hypothetical protein
MNNTGLTEFLLKHVFPFFLRKQAIVISRNSCDIKVAADQQNQYQIVPKYDHYVIWQYEKIFISNNKMPRVSINLLAPEFYI